jgi:hypothetical protein
MTMAEMSVHAIYEAARSAGFSDTEAATFTAIALAESSGRPGARNDRGEDSRGLWQINVAADQTRETEWGDLYDPVNNARAAFAISGGGRDIRPWTTTHDHNKGTARDYRQYLDEVEEGVGVRGDPRGVGGYHSSLPTAWTGASSSTSSQQENGLDGRSSMTASERTEFGGQTVDGRTAEMLEEAERLANEEDPSIGAFTLSQGSFSHGVQASAGTHGGPGAFDMGTAGYTEEQQQIIGLAFRRVGFASWERHPDEGNWPGHWHGIAMGCDDLPPVAQQQVDSYLQGRSGLVSNREDRDPRPQEILTWEQYQEKYGSGAEATSSADAPTAEEVLDSDGDGLSDSFERLAGTKLTSVDSDDDGLSDGEEAAVHHTNPRSADTDGDTIEDADEIAKGTDAGRLPGVAGVIGTGVFAENVRTMKDTDDDGLSDKSEKLLGLDHERVDTDGDGESDGSEASVGTDPTRADTDLDGLTDGLELRHGTNPWSSGVDDRGRSVETPQWNPERAYAERQQAAGPEDAAPGATPTSSTVSAVSSTAPGDQGEAGTPPAASTGEATPLPGARLQETDGDGDGLTDAFERLAGFSLDAADTDADGVTDGDEVLAHRTDPRSADTDGDGIPDSEEIEAGSDAGTLAGTGGVVGLGRFAVNARGGLKDSDEDGISDHAEKLLGTDHKRADSDEDDLTDAEELSLGTDPLLKDSDYDGLLDGFEFDHHLDPLTTWVETAAAAAQSVEAPAEDSVGID